MFFLEQSVFLQGDICTTIPLPSTPQFGLNMMSLPVARGSCGANDVGKEGLLEIAVEDCSESLLGVPSEHLLC